MQPLLSPIIAGAVLLAGCQGPVTPAPEDSPPLASTAPPPVPYDIFEWGRPTTIPAGNDAGVLIGPLSTHGEGRTIRDVAVRLDVSHPYTGRLSAKLLYDSDRDAELEVETALEFYLAAAGLEARPSYAYPIALDGAYFFRHEQRTADLEDWDLGSFDRFRGLSKGGDFYLWVADTGPGLVGTVEGWSVYVR